MAQVKRTIEMGDLSELDKKYVKKKDKSEELDLEKNWFGEKAPSKAKARVAARHLRKLAG